MSYATCNQYGKAEVGIDSAGLIKISVKDTSVHMRPQDAVRVRDDLSRAITEAATATAKAVQAAQEATA